MPSTLIAQEGFFESTSEASTFKGPSCVINVDRMLNSNHYIYDACRRGKKIDPHSRLMIGCSFAPAPITDPKLVSQLM